MNRREALRTLAAGGATGALAAGVIVATTPAPAASDIEHVIEAELSAYRVALAEEDRAHEQYHAANKSLPEWVRVGRSELNSDGTKGGHMSGWPEMADLTPPPAGETKLIRQGPREYWKNRKDLLTRGGDFIKHEDGSFTVTASVRLPPAECRAIRLETFAGMRVLIARKREAMAIRDAAGISQIEQAMRHWSDEVAAIEARVVSLASGCTLPDIGVQAFFAHRAEESDFTVTMLRRLLPHLNGTLRELVAADLADFDRLNEEA